MAHTLAFTLLQKLFHELSAFADTLLGCCRQLNKTKQNNTPFTRKWAHVFSRGQGHKIEGKIVKCTNTYFHCTL